MGSARAKAQKPDNSVAQFYAAIWSLFTLRLTLSYIYKTSYRLNLGESNQFILLIGSPIWQYYNKVS